MWTPKQLLHPKIVDALYLGGFSTLQIELLGWLSYNAAALNNSRNPVKAAHTILSHASDPDHKMSRMLAKFVSRKEDSVAPKKTEGHAEADRILGGLEDWIGDKTVQAQMRAVDFDEATLERGVSDGGEPPKAKAASAGEEDGDEG